MTASTETVPAASEQKNSRLKNMGLFLLSPFIGLVYAILLPGKLLQLAKRDLKASAEDKKP